MRKIVKASEMGRIEKVAYSKGASEEAFMENAGRGIAEAVQRMVATFHLKPKILLLAGKGNNGGDAYVAGRLLLAGGFPVEALALVPLEEGTSLCLLQGTRFQSAGGKINFVRNQEEISFGGAHLLVDGIYGTGFQGEVKGLQLLVIQKANASGLPILAIDIPSGVNGDTGEKTVAIQATETVFLGLPKSGCFLGKAWNCVGNVSVYDFGLEKERIEDAVEDFNLLDEQDISLPPIERVRHKYEAGYVVGLSGSKGMPGAPILSGWAALRSGAGIVRLLHPLGMEAELSASPFELIKEGYKLGETKSILEAFERATALFIGPGIGTSPSVAKMLQKVLKTEKPCVIDAEALTLIAAHKMKIPSGAILTPHHGEMKRLLHLTEEVSSVEFLKKVQNFVEKNNVTVVLKGSPTFILHSRKKPYVCSRGDPGMATAGSGDVLTGIIAAMLAQKKNPLEAALLGVLLHGIAGERAAQKMSSYSMTASDIIANLPEVFKSYQK